MAVRIRGKRELLAKVMLRSGAYSLATRLPPRNSLLVLNYHRIGNRAATAFDPGVVSATAQEFDDQISWMKRRLSLVTLEEAIAFIGGSIKEQKACCRLLITFDDGYLDNYQIAYPILRSHGVQGVFFLVTGFVGTSHIPWWDHIAYLLKTGRRRRFSLHFPAELTIDINKNGLTESLRSVLNLYKRPDNSAPARFIRDLTIATEGDDPPETLRRFLNWDEAREMIRGGMAIGSHTHSHNVLGQLDPTQQFDELTTSRAILGEKLGISADVLAYPVGSITSFSDQTKKIAREVGYRAAFSFHGGKNLKKRVAPFDIKRSELASPNCDRFRVQVSMSRLTGGLWP